MAMVDPFLGTGFDLTSLTASINNLKFQPRRMASFFEESGVSTTTVTVEERNGILSILTPQQRGASGTILSGESRKMLPFVIPHIPVRDNLLADEIQGIRAFGSENLNEVLTTRLNEKLQYMRNSIDYTSESHRVSAVKGNYIDANGDEQSLFTAFSVSQQTKALGLSTSNSSSIRGKMFDVQKKINSALDGVPWSGMTVLCGDTFWDALITDKDTNATYLNQVQAAELRGNPVGSFAAFGANWEWYRGTSSVNLGSDAYVIPTGVPGLCITRYAPANYNETVNTIGLPYYVKSELLKFGKGYELEAQSNQLNIITRPAAIIKLTVS